MDKGRITTMTECQRSSGMDDDDDNYDDDFDENNGDDHDVHVNDIHPKDGQKEKNMLLRYRTLVAAKSFERTASSKSPEQLGEKADVDADADADANDDDDADDDSDNGYGDGRSGLLNEKKGAADISSERETHAKVDGGKRQGKGSGTVPPESGGDNGDGNGRRKTPNNSSPAEEDAAGNSDKENDDPLRIVLLRRMKSRQQSRSYRPGRFGSASANSVAGAHSNSSANAVAVSSANANANASADAAFAIANANVGAKPGANTRAEAGLNVDTDVATSAGASESSSPDVNAFANEESAKRRAAERRAKKGKHVTICLPVSTTNLDDNSTDVPTGPVEIIAQSPARRPKTGLTMALSPRQSPHPTESFDETVISSADTFTVAKENDISNETLKKDKGEAEENAVSQSFLFGLPTPDEAMEAMVGIEEHAARANNLLNGRRNQRSAEALETSCTDADGSIWAMCSAYATYQNSPFANITGGDVEGEAADVTAPNPQSSTNDDDDDDDDDAKRNDNRGVIATNVGRREGGILQEPGEMISLLGESFLDATIEDDGGEAVPKRELGILSTLAESEDGADRDGVESFASSKDSSQVDNVRRTAHDRRAQPQSREARPSAGKTAKVENNSNHFSSTDDDALLIPPPTSARSARSACSFGTFSIPDVSVNDSGDEDVRFANETREEFPDWVDDDRKIFEGNHGEVGDISIVASVVSIDGSENNNKCNDLCAGESEFSQKTRGRVRSSTGTKLSVHQNSTSHADLRSIATSSESSDRSADSEKNEKFALAIGRLKSELDVAEARTVQERRRRKEAEERITQLEKRMSSLEMSKGEGRIDGGDASSSPVDGAAVKCFTNSTPNPANAESNSNAAASAASIHPATASLIERNKTLVKEVRFADQTCVELAERNSALQSENERLSAELAGAMDECVRLRGELLESERHGAKMEQQRDTALERIEVARLDNKRKLQKAEATFSEMKANQEELKKQILEESKYLAASEARAAGAEARIASLKVERDSFLKAASDLREQLASVKFKFDQKNFEASSVPTDRHEVLVRKHEKLTETVEKERADKCRYMIERDELRVRCAELEEHISAAEKASESNYQLLAKEELSTGTPQIRRIGPHLSKDQQSSLRTPTSNVLAKTLRSELRRGQEDRDRLVDAERYLAETETRLHMALAELDEAKAETAEILEQLRECERRLSKCERDKDELQMSLEISRVSNMGEIGDPFRLASVDTSGLELSPGTSGQLEMLVDEVDQLRTRLCDRQDELVEAQSRIACMETDLDDAQTRMLRALHDREALVAEVRELKDALNDAQTEEVRLSDANVVDSACIQSSIIEDDAIKQTKDSVFAAITQMTNNSEIMHQAAERKLRAQCETVSRLSQEVRYLQSQLEFQESAIGTECLSGVRSADEESMSDMSEIGDNRDYGSNKNDSVINATFASGRATRDSKTHASEQNTLELMEEARFHESELREKLLITTERLNEVITQRKELVDELEMTRSELQEQKDAVICLKAEIGLKKDLEVASDQYSKEVGRLNAELVAVKSKLRSCQNDLGDSERQNDCLQEEKAQLMNKIEELEAEIVQVEQLRKKSEEAFSNASRAHASERLSRQNDFEVMETKLDECTSKLEASEEELENFRQEAAEMLSALEMEKDDLVEESERLKAQLRERDVKIEHEIKLASRAQAEANKCQQSKVDVEKQLEKSQGMVDLLQKKLKRLADTADETKSELDLCRSELRTANENIVALESEKGSLKEDVESAMTTLHRIEYDRATLSSDLKDLEEAKDQVERSLRSELGDANKMISDLREELGTQQQEVTKTKGELEQTQQESENHLNRCLDLEDEIERNKLKIDHNETRIEELEEDLHACTKEMEMLKTSYVACNDKLAGAMERNHNNEACIEDLKKKVATTEEKLADVIECLSGAKEELTLIKQQRDELKRLTQSMDKEAQKLQKELDAIKIESREKLEEKERAIDELAKDKKARISCLEDRLSSVYSERNQALEDMRQATARFTCELADIVAAANEAATQCGFSAKAVRAKLAELPASATSPGLKGIKNSSDKARQCLAVFGVIVAKVSEQADSLRNAESEKQRLTREVTAHCRSKEELRVYLAEEKEKANQCEAKLKKLSKQLEVSSSTLATTEAALRKSKKSMAIVESELESTLKDFDDMKQMNEEHEQMEKALRATIRERDDALERLGETQQTIESLVRQREDTANELWNAKTNASKAEEELRKKTTELTKKMEDLASMDRKSARLREYIKKLTAKCTEWAESYQTQSHDLFEARKAHQLAMDKMTELEKLKTSKNSCSECKVLGTVIKTELSKCEALHEEVDRRNGDIEGMKQQISEYKSKRSSKKAVSWNTTPIDKSGPIQYPKTPLQSLDENTLNRRKFSTPRNMSVDL